MNRSSSPLSVRRATPADLSAVDALLAASYPVLLRADYPPSVMVTALPIISRAQPGLLASGSYFLVEDQTGAVLGAGGWTVEAPGAKPGRRGVGHIRHVVTDHRHVRRGIGRLLMQHVMTDARAAGMTRLECQSTLTARHFYAAMGFVEQGEIAIELRPGIRFPAVFMTAHL